MCCLHPKMKEVPGGNWFCDSCVNCEECSVTLQECSTNIEDEKVIILNSNVVEGEVVDKVVVDGSMAIVDSSIHNGSNENIYDNNGNNENNKDDNNRGYSKNTNNTSSNFEDNTMDIDNMNISPQKDEIKDNILSHIRSWGTSLSVCTICEQRNTKAKTDLEVSTLSSSPFKSYTPSLYFFLHFPRFSPRMYLLNVFPYIGEDESRGSCKSGIFY